MANVLQVYDGYVMLKMYDKLADYHAKVFNYTRGGNSKAVELAKLCNNPIIIR